MVQVEKRVYRVTWLGSTNIDDLPRRSDVVHARKVSDANSCAITRVYLKQAAVQLVADGDVVARVAEGVGTGGVGIKDDLEKALL